MNLTTLGSSFDNVRQKIDAFRTVDAGGSLADPGTQQHLNRALRTFIGEALTAAAKRRHEGRKKNSATLANLAEHQERDPEQSNQACMLLAEVLRTRQR